MPEQVPPVRPRPDKLTAFFWEGARNHKLLIQRCRECGHFQHWPEPICSACLSFDLGPQEVSGSGAIYTFEIANQAFHPYFSDKVPFAIAVVELVEQPNLRLVTNIVDTALDDINVGDEVVVTWKDMAFGLTGFTLPVFRPRVAGRQEKR